MEWMCLPTCFKSVKPPPVHRVVVPYPPRLGRQPHRVMFQFMQWISLDESAQAGRLETIEDDGLGEVALTQAMFHGIVVTKLLVVRLETEADVDETAPVDVAATSREWTVARELTSVV